MESQGNDCHCRYEGNGIKAEYVLSTGKRNGAVRPHSNLHKKVQVSKGTTFIEKFKLYDNSKKDNIRLKREQLYLKKYKQENAKVI